MANLPTASDSRDNTVSTASAKDDSSMSDNNSDSSPQPRRNEKSTPSNEIEPLHFHDDTVILQSCPSVNGIFCDSVNSIAEILSMDGGDDELQEPTPSCRRDSQPMVDPKACLTPTSEHGCQRRGRFLIWPASLSTPSLNLPDTRGA